MSKISIVIPCYNESETLELLFKELQKLPADIPEAEFEFVFVDDGSSDGTLDGLRELARREENVFYIGLSRNFGKEAAMLSGLKFCSGDYVAVMDADLQDPPALLGQMYRAVVEEGYDCAAARRTDRRGEPRVRSFFAKAFYRLINRLSQTEIVDGARDFRLMTRQMVDAILDVSEYNRFSKGIFGWVGFRTKWINYQNVDRVAGKTKWSFWGLLRYSIEGIVAFSTAPLTVAFILGIVFCVVSFAAIIFIVIRQMLYGGSAFGWPSTICIIFFLSGIQLFCMGIIGQYMAKTYLETKHRPIFIVRETNLKNKRTEEDSGN